jgi:hypothetical protein
MKFTLPAGLLLLLLPCGLVAQPFDFHNGFWTNLHHFLLQQSIEPGDGDSLPADEKATWTEAVHYYQLRFAGEDRLGREMETIKNNIEDHDRGERPEGAGLGAELVTVLEKAAPVYRAHWWPEQSKINGAWINSETPLIEKYGPTVIPRLAVAYATPWPDGPIRVDVVWYGRRVTAYTTLSPTRITVPTGDPRSSGLDGLETLFHEASHGQVAKLRRTISEDARKENKLLPRRDLWHALLFYTTGEIVAEAVAKDAPEHVPYATSEGLWERSWKGYPQIFEKEWTPWMKAERGFEESVQRVVDAVLSAHK